MPSCLPCNNERSQLDEEFKAYLGVFLGTDMPEQNQFWKDRALRTIAHNKRLHRQLLSEMREAWIRSPGGVITSKATVVPWNKKKHNQMIGIIIRRLPQQS